MTEAQAQEYGIVVGESFYPLLDDRKRYLVMCGGAGSGKSEFAVRKIIYRCETEGNHRFLLLRKVRSRARESIVEVMRQYMLGEGIAHEFNKTDRTIRYFNMSGQPNEILFDGLDDPLKIKSIKGITGIWLEETTEFTKDDFAQIDLRLREPGPAYLQIIMTFNPDEAAAPWLKKRFFDALDPDATVHRSTVRDNPIEAVRDAYAKQLERIDDETYRLIYLMGEWALPTGIIYNWDVVPMPERYDEMFYGLDFGFSVDPAALVQVYRRADEYWLRERLYATGMTNQDLASAMRTAGVSRGDEVFADSAEPKSIEELVRAGYNVIPASKGDESVRAGIDFLRSKTIHIVDGSENLVEERRAYKFKADKSGNPTPKPVKFNDHLMDAARYAIYTNAKVSGAYAGTVAHDVYPD